MDKHELRKQAEIHLDQQTLNLHELSEDAVQKLVSELHVHQIELELQNKELLRNQDELERSTRKYATLYDFAPVGYCTLERDGTVRELNLTAANQLGLSRAEILGTQLYQYINEEDWDRFFLHLRTIFENQSPQSCELRFLRQDASLFYGHLESSAVQTNEDRPCVEARLATSLSGKRSSRA